MSFEHVIETSLAAALSDDHALVAELRAAFQASAGRHVAALREASTLEDWRDAALRLKGLAASFGASELMIAAGRAAAGRCGERSMLAAIEAAVAALDA